MAEAVIVSAVRLPTGKFLGTLKDFTAPALGALVVREAVARAGIDPASVDECIMGNVVSGGEGQAPARQAALKGGLSDHVARAHHQQGVRLGPQGGDAGAAGHPHRRHRDCGGRRHGVDEQRPVLPPARPRGPAHGPRTGRRLDDSRWAVVPVRELAHGERRRDGRRGLQGVPRRAGRLLRREPPKAAAAQASGAFKDEILPVSIPQKKGDPLVFDKDESVRADTTAETLHTRTSAGSTTPARPARRSSASRAGTPRPGCSWAPRPSSWSARSPRRARSCRPSRPTSSRRCSRDWSSTRSGTRHSMGRHARIRASSSRTSATTSRCARTRSRRTSRRTTAAATAGRARRSCSPRRSRRAPRSRWRCTPSARAGTSPGCASTSSTRRPSAAARRRSRS